MMEPKRFRLQAITRTYMWCGKLSNTVLFSSSYDNQLRGELLLKNIITVPSVPEIEMENLLRRIVGENYTGTLQLLNNQEVDVEAFYSLDNSVLREIGE